MPNIKTLIYVYLFVFASSVLFACKETPKDEPLKISDRIFDIKAKSGMMYKRGQQDSAIRFLDSAIAKIQLTSVEQWSVLNTKTAYFLNFKKRPDSALKLADSMVKVVEAKPALIKHYISALLVRGDVLMDFGLYEDAFDAYVRAGKISNSISKCYALSPKLGFLRYKQGFFQESIPYFKKGFNETLACADTSSFEQSFVSPQGLLNTIGLCFEKLKQPDSALFYYQKALHFIDERSLIFPNRKEFALMAKGVIYGNMATAFMQKGQHQQTEKFLLKSIQINSQKGAENGDAQTARIKLINLYTLSKQYRKARLLIEEMENADSSFKNFTSQESIMKFLYAKWKFYDTVQDTKMAYINLERFHFLKDSTETANRSRQNVDVEHGLRDADRAQMLELLKKDAQSKQFLIVVAGIVIALIFVILFIVLKNLKRSKANIESLNAANNLVQNQYAQLTQVFSVLEKSHVENATIMKVVAHDLRGPVSGIVHAAKLILADEDLSENNFRMLQLVKDAGLNAISLINEMLNTHHGLGEKEPTDIARLLNDSMNLLHFKAEAKAQKISVTADHIIVLVNKDKISRVINNLLTNAIKFSGENDTITIAAVQQEQEVVISIADQGMGIPAHMGNGIFDMFSDNRRLGTASEESFGMGLAISKEIIESHGGKIWYTSIEGVGTTFYFSLPL